MCVMGDLGGGGGGGHDVHHCRVPVGPSGVKNKNVEII